MIKISKMAEHCEYQYAIENTATGYGDKAYSLSAAQQIAKDMQAKTPHVAIASLEPVGFYG